MSEVADPRPAAGWAGGDPDQVRALVLRLPSDVAIRFGVLVLLTVATTADILIMTLGAATGADRRFFTCATESRLFTTGVDTAAYQQFSDCFGAGAARLVTAVTVTLVLLSVVVLIAFLAYPRLLVRRRGLTPLHPEHHPELHAYLQDLCRLAGLARPVVFLIDPTTARPVGQAFGRTRRHQLSLGAGLLTLYATNRPRFRSVVLHELAHLRNRDVSLTYLALVTWRVFVALVLLPWALVTVFSGLWRGAGPDRLATVSQGLADLEWWRVAILLVLVFLARNAVLRAREYAADARAALWDAEAESSLRRAAMVTTRRRWWRPGPVLVHPSPRNRLAALADPVSMLVPSIWAVAAAGLATGLLVKHFEVPFFLLGFSGARVLVPGLLALFAGALGGFVALLGWRIAAYARLRGRFSPRLVLVCLAAGVGLLPATWLTFLYPRLPSGGATGLIVHAAPALVITFAVLWAYADADRWLTATRVERVTAPIVRTVVVCAVLIAGWAGWWSDPTWRNDLPGLVAIVGGVRDEIATLGWGWAGWLPHLVVELPAAVLARDVTAQVAAILIWLVPMAGIVGRSRSWPAGTIRYATRCGLFAGGAVLLLDLVLRTVAAGLKPDAPTALNAFAMVVASWQILVIGLVQAGTAVLVRRSGPGLALPALFAAYLAGLLGFLALVFNSVAGGCLPWLDGCGSWPSALALSRTGLSIPIIGTIMAAVTVSLLRASRRARLAAAAQRPPVGADPVDDLGDAPAAPHGAEARRRPSAARLAATVPAALALIAVLGVGLADRVVDDAYANTPNPLPGQPLSGDPAVTAAAVRSWLRDGGREAVDALEAASDALNAADSGADPAAVVAACRQLDAALARATQLPPPPDAEAGESWAKSTDLFKKTIAACPARPGADSSWQSRQRADHLTFGRASLLVTKLFLTGALQHAGD